MYGGRDNFFFFFSCQGILMLFFPSGLCERVLSRGFWERWCINVEGEIESVVQSSVLVEWFSLCTSWGCSRFECVVMVAVFVWTEMFGLCVVLKEIFSVQMVYNTVRSSDIWLILPVVICLSQRLSHAGLSPCQIKVRPRMAHYISYGSLDLRLHLDNPGNSRANTCIPTPTFGKVCFY